MYFDENVLYDAIVVTNKVDPNMTGGVQARIIGYTDELDDDAQPFVYPELNCANAVPEKGYYLRVRFEHGNILYGHYVAVSETKEGFFSPLYNGAMSYPNVAVFNMGGDGYLRYYDRTKQMDTIDCPNGGHIIWDGESKIAFRSDKAYDNAGDGAKQDNGKAEHGVLTEATIDIFTCMPVGRGMINQGSEYLNIPHVSRKTIETYKNQTAEDLPTQEAPTPEGDPQATFMAINDIQGSKVAEVELSLTQNYISRFDKEIDKIIIGISEGKSFPEMADEYMKSGSQSSAHYLVGRIDGDPEVASDNPLKPLNNSGFLQFVNIEHDAYYGSSVNDSNEQPANRNAVSIMLISDSKPISLMKGFTEFQKDMVKKLIAHIRNKAGDETIPVMSGDDFTGTPGISKVDEKFE